MEIHRCLVFLFYLWFFPLLMYFCTLKNVYGLNIYAMRNEPLLTNYMQDTLFNIILEVISDIQLFTKKIHINLEPVIEMI